jgi:anti-sigma regulatory factor (Ser/Thr protein kinase)
MSSPKRLQLCFDAVPASIAQARSAVAELGSTLGMGVVPLGDLKTVVSEACSNVVRHAYPRGGGDFELEAVAKQDELEVVVRDSGQGLSPRLRSNSTSFGLGLGLISTLSSRFEIHGRTSGGTEVRISLPLPA